MHETFEVLSENVNLGRNASEFIEDLKRFTYKEHTLFYFITPNGIFIIRVLSQRMDYDYNINVL